MKNDFLGMSLKLCKNNADFVVVVVVVVVVYHKRLHFLSVLAQNMSV